MCGFVGYKNNFESTISSIEENKIILKKMTDLIAHRGPDAERFFTDEHVSLGFRRLAFIDIHGDTSPLSNDSKDKTLVFNGEIYNFKILREELVNAGYKFKTEGDAEVLLHGYDFWGIDLLTRLRGMFSFAIYDKLKNEIFIARDYFGIKPLYYFHNEKSFIFASELKAFLPHREFIKEFDESLLPAYLSFSCVPGGEDTFFKNVKKLMPGNYLKYNLLTNEIKINEYFTPKFKIDNAQTFEKSVEKIKTKVSESVEAHLLSEVPIAGFLSGGIDSAYVTAEFIKHINADTYTIDFKESKYSEADDATHSAKVIGVKNERAIVNKETYLENSSKVQYHMDEPLANPSANLLYELSQRASQDVKAVLSGEGADEMFGGYNVYQEPLALSNYQKLPLSLRRLISKCVDKLPNFYGKNFLKRGAQTIEERYIGNSNIFTVLEQEKILKDYYKYNQNYKPQNYTNKIYNQINPDGKLNNILDDVSKMQFLDINLWMLQEILQKADKMSMAHSLELRVPFLDIEIWNLAKTLPLASKVNKENTKLAFRAAGLSVLDKEISERKKRAFPSPLPDWIRTDLYINKIKEEFMSDTANKYFNKHEILKLLEDNTKGIRNNTRKIWTIYTFLIWYKEYFILR